MLRRLLTALCVIAACAVTVSVTRAVTPAATAAEPVVLDFTVKPPDELNVGAKITLDVDPAPGFGGRVTVSTPTICSGQGTNTAVITGLAVGDCNVEIECFAVPRAGTAAAGTTTSSSSSSTSIGTTTSSTAPPSPCVGAKVVIKVTEVPPRPIPEYVPLVPVRVLETRNIPARGIAPIGGQPARTGTRPVGGERVMFSVVGKSTFRGESVPPKGAEAVVLNVTGVDVDQDGFVTAWDCATDRPVVSNLNLSRVPAILSDVADHDARANLVVTKMDKDGFVCLYVQHGTHLVADLNGYFPPGAPYVAKLPPKRVLETREGEEGFVRVKPAANAPVTIDLAAATEVGARGVVLNITGVNTAAPGFVTVWDCQGSPPATSNLNLPGGLHATPNLVVSALSPARTVCLQASVSTDLVVDLFGEFTARSKFNAVKPVRVLETRTKDATDAAASITQLNYRGDKPPAESVIRLTFANGAITDAGDKPDAVVLDVTGTEPNNPGFVTIWPCEEQRPLASNVNMARLGPKPTDLPSVSNLIIAKTDSTGSVCLYTQRGTHLVADLYGFFPFGSAGG